MTLPEVDGSSAGRLMVQMMANFSEFERRRIGERTKEAFAILHARGVKPGGSAGMREPDRRRSQGASEAAGKARTTQGAR